jgi:hypothetical protein
MRQENEATNVNGVQTDRLPGAPVERDLLGFDLEKEGWPLKCKP